MKINKNTYKARVNNLLHTMLDRLENSIKNGEIRLSEIEALFVLQGISNDLINKKNK